MLNNSWRPLAANLMQLVFRSSVALLSLLDLQSTEPTSTVITLACALFCLYGCRWVERWLKLSITLHQIEF
eukprot:1523783-Pyramimonas_sp.AAC.1